ncbi:MAG: 4-hydroxy-tetrahydrodipicolinate synthase [Candidatus Lambdaproteobacteria bacterium]|nr:4-hydroxy-tetrahydrodipicolinate synthase [Candidatus Lambdaproteobacteria bacterium]
MGTSQYTGVGTAMITPFDKDGAVDHAKLAEFVEFQIAGGVNFLVPCGTTGESATMTEEEQFAVTKTTLQAARGRVPVLAGCGGNNTAEIIARGKHMKALGVTHILSVSPYYNKPTQEGIYQHYKAIRKQTGLEIVLYSVQSRTGSNVAPETVARLTEEQVIFGIKEASGSVQQIQKICDLTAGRLQVLSGDDAITLPLMAVGGVGVISVASNVVPGPMREWLDTMLAANFDKARALLHRLLPLFEALFVESNPIPVKGAASLLGLMDATYRLPLVAPAESTMHLLKQALAPFRGK